MLDNNVPVENQTVDTAVSTDANTETVDTNTSINENDILLSMVGGNENTEQQATQTETVETQSSGNVSLDGVNLDEVDLSWLGIDTQEQQETTIKSETVQQEQQPDINQQLLDAINKINQPSNKQQEQMSEEDAATVELFNRFKALGLIPENNGLSDEDKQLLQDAKRMNESFKQQEQYQQQVQEHNTKLTALGDFSKQLETAIPGYSTELMQKVVGDIHAKNPEAALRIFNDPKLLITLWGKVGAKSQPQQTQSNVISPNGQQNRQMQELEQKVKNGTATEQDEAMWLMNS